ncbi:DUF2163 domain-containing protein [Aurantimonas aggregata]|uniref:DUF2163 domain-containing protein n=1 Tax=Aurantimonas aggregata TaxID=2047720 RepID=A0A6L9MJH1_9HYPH|nr:DUF2163 domain-containing protein [Aurantimonas aggregata]NDV87778.1 DUF2163 domain-containing protein [Aurantimonas aggregata]
MRDIPAALAAHLARPTTTLAHGWRLTRQDGAVFGFTDHDAPLDFAGTVFEAATGLGATEAEETLGLAATTAEVEGALSSAAISEADIRAGRFDGARVEIFVVDWQDPASHLLLDVAELGEVKYGETGFAAELRGRTASLDRVRGRLYRRRCDAVFGDHRCRFPAQEPPFTTEVTIAGVESGAVLVAGDLGGDPGRFGHGRAVFLEGAAAGLAAEIVTAAATGLGTVRVALADPPEAALQAGDRLRLTEGCDRQFATCRDRFGNQANFRGFPHIPGGDQVFSIAKSDGVHDGAPVVP